MHLKHLFLLLFTFCVIGNLSAQKKNKKNKVEIIEFGEDSENEERNDLPLTGIVIKTSPTSYLLGSQFIEVEKYMTDYLSLQAGVGLTFKSIIGDTYNEILAELQEEEDGLECESELWGQNDICDSYTDFSIRNQKPGLVISGSARLFFDDDAMDGGFFAVKLRHSTVKYQIQDIVQNASSVERLENTFVSESIKRFDIVGHYGYQALYSRLSAEYFVGVGARIRKETRQDLGQSTNGIVQSKFRSFKKTGLRLEIGLRIGFQL